MSDNPQAYFHGLRDAMNAIANIDADSPRFKRCALQRIVHLILAVEDAYPGTLPEGGYSFTLLLREINNTAVEQVDRTLTERIAALLRGPGFIMGGRPLRPDIVEDWSMRLADGLAQLLDNPDADATDYAHPAWWRGELAGVDGTVRALSDILERGLTSGVFSHPGLKQLAERIAVLRLKSDNREETT